MGMTPCTALICDGDLFVLSELWKCSKKYWTSNRLKKLLKLMVQVPCLIFQLLEPAASEFQDLTVLRNPSNIW
jgi:hypothetical protein